MIDNIFGIKDKIVIITGSSRGLGKEIARLFLYYGAKVIITGTNEKEVKDTISTLKSLWPNKVSGLHGDISDPLMAPKIILYTMNVFGFPDHVICNAGIDIIKPAECYTNHEWNKVIDVNLNGVFYMAQSAAQNWISSDKKDVSITITSSIAGKTGISNLAPYSASKGAINQLVKTLAVEWAKKGIRVNAIAPGYISNIMENVYAHENKESEEKILNRTPLGRRGEKIEIAAPYVFLASPAASFITGSILTVDGGYTSN